MGQIILVTGGARSGKSRFAQQWCEARPGARSFLATCPRLDGEMQDRIARHRADRAGRGWDTIEEELDLAGALGRCPPQATVLVDCLTLWISNLLFRADQGGPMLDEDAAGAAARAVAAAARARPGATAFVTNEVGLGIVPANDLARRFRDCAGRCNQAIAAAADEVQLLVSGLPLRIK